MGLSVNLGLDMERAVWWLGRLFSMSSGLEPYLQAPFMVSRCF